MKIIILAVLALSSAIAAGTATAAATVSTMLTEFSGSCMDIPDGSSKGGVGLQEWTCDGGSNQSFAFTPLANGYYTIQPESDLSMCLDAGSGSITTGVQIVQNTCTDGTSQQWGITANANRSFTIITARGDGCMDVYAGRTANGTIVTTYACHGSNNEQFVISGLTVAPPTTTLSATRAARIAAFASGPLVAGTPWTASESVAVDTVRQIGGGQHLVYTVAGTTGTVEPALSATVLDGRPIADGTATAYVNGRVLTATQRGAPIVSSAPNATSGGLVETDFAAGNFVPALYSAVQGCMSTSFAESFVGHYCFANGPAAGSGNSTAYGVGAGLSPSYTYHSNTWEEQFVVIDRYFGLVFANSASPINVEIDGVQVQAGPAISTGTPGWTLTFDYQDVVKSRTVTVISAAGSILPTLRGVALTSTGSVAPGTTSSDQVLILGDSINATVVPITEAGTQMMSYWIERYLGFGGVINMAVGGSGYLSQNTNTFNIPNLLANPVNQALLSRYASNITHVIIGAGFNDRDAPVAIVRAAALATWKTIRALLPNAKISITDGWSGSSGPDANALALAAGLATTFAAWGDGNSRLIHSIGTSTATAYVNGTGNAGTPLTTGNSSIYTSTDGVHPSPAGARYIARRLSDDIISAWAGAY